jgi:methylase of polypeptide subunit release factors
MQDQQFSRYSENKGLAAMRDNPAILDRTEVEILSFDVSDEALELAAATAAKAEALSFSFCTSPYTCPWS